MEEDINILEKRVEIDRRLRNNSTESDYDKFCENECIAIEQLIKGYRELEERNKILNESQVIKIKKIQELEEKIHKEHTLGYSQGVYDCSEAWKETIQEIKTKNEKKIGEMRPYKHQAPFDFGVLNGIDECCRKLLEDK